MKNDQVYLAQIIDAVGKIKAFTTGMDYERFANDQKTQSAVIMQLAIIGELAKRVSSETQAKINLPWKAIAGFRDRAIHDYYQIDIEIVWDTVMNDLGTIEKEIGNTITE